MEWERTTDRLLLRRWIAEDREPFAALNSDPEVMRHFPALLSRDESDALIDRVDGYFDDRGYGLWALQRLDTGEFIGFAGLARMPAGTPDPGGIEIGWRLAKAHWGHGFATEAARSALAFAFDDLALPHVNSITAIGNLRSQAVMERLGMHVADYFDHPLVPEGSPVRAHVRYLIDAPR